MGRVLHGSVTTTGQPVARSQCGDESVGGLAGRSGVGPTTVQTWRERASTADARMGPEEARSPVLTVVEGAIIGAFRRHTGRVERMNRTIEDAMVKRSHSDGHDQRRTHLHRCGGANDPARRRTTLQGPTSTEFILDAWTKEPIPSGSTRPSASRDHAPGIPGRGGAEFPDAMVALA